MHIKFVCRCGKHLRAREEMAARRSMCPRCGAPVGIPSLQPTHRGTTLASLALGEGRRTGLTSSAACAVTSTETARHGAQTAPSPRAGWRQRRWVETRWYQSLLLPRGAWPLILGLAVVLTLWCGLVAFSLPGLFRYFDERGLPLWSGLPFLCVPLAVLGYASGFLDCVFASGVAGEVGNVSWPGRKVALALKSGFRWLICFLAGPIVPAGTAALYWIHAGQLGFLDTTILAELSILAIGSWFLLLLAVNHNDRLRNVNPLRVVNVIQRLGHRLVALAMFTAVVLFAQGWLASFGLDKIVHGVGAGWLWLFLSWTSGLFFSAFVFRWAGVWFYWARIQTKISPRPADSRASSGYARTIP